MLTNVFENVQVSEGENCIPDCMIPRVKSDDPFPTLAGKIEYIKMVGMPYEWVAKVLQAESFEMRLKLCEGDADALARLEAEIVDAYRERRKERGHEEA